MISPFSLIFFAYGVWKNRVLIGSEGAETNNALKRMGEGDRGGADLAEVLFAPLSCKDP